MSESTPSTCSEWTLAAHNKPTTILNDYYSHSSGGRPNLYQFTCFNLLPAEIRQIIWQHALQGNRFICVKLVLGGEQADRSALLPTHIPNATDQANAAGVGCYRLRITSKHRCNPLLAVSREARDAGLSFYRVHIPFISQLKRETRYLYFNPEFDILHVDANDAPESLVEFLSDVRAFDPRAVGVQNMSIGGEEDLSQLQLPADPSCHETEALAAFQETVTRLKRVFFRAVVMLEARHMFASLQLSEVRFNRSFPLYAQREEFDILESDLRPISDDLERVCLGYDPRSILYAWHEMERRFTIDRTQYSPQSQFLITAPIDGETNPRQIHSREDVDSALRFEAEHWRSVWIGDTLYTRCSYESPDTPEKLRKAPLPAVGFWLFPQEALGEPVDAHGQKPQACACHGRIWWNNTTVLDLSKHQPQLGLFQLQ